MANVFWLTGLSSSGKTTIANRLKETINCIVLDGDVIRQGLCSDLGFSIEDRNENIRRIAEVARIIHGSEMNVVVAFISPIRKQRDFVRALIGNGFMEIYLSTSLEECEKRDVKGLYKKARAGIIKEFTGIDSIYEPPVSPELTFDTARVSVADIVKSIIRRMYGI